MCIQETHFQDGDRYNFTIPGYSMYTRNVNADSRQGGVALYVLNTIPHSEIPLQSALQAVACHMNVSNHRFTICSLYLPPNKPLAETDLRALVSQFDEDFLICSDANAKHSAWGSPMIDRRGRVLFDFLLNNHLHILNDGSGTRFDTYTGQLSHIDVTVCSAELARHLNWRVQADCRNSDHFPIDVVPSFTSPDQQGNGSGRLRWSVRRSNWQGFTRHCTPVCDTSGDTDDIDELCEGFTQHIIDTAKCYVPVTGRRKSRHQNMWWNDECRRAVARRKRALMRYKRCVCQAHLTELQRERAITQRVIRQTKRQSWNDYINSFTVSTPISRIWNMVRSFNNTRHTAPSLPVILHNGERFDSPDDVVRLFGEYFSSLSKSTNYRQAFQIREHALRNREVDFSSSNDEVYNSEFKIDELTRAIEESGSTSVGPDLIHYSFLRHLTLAAREELLKLFNTIWTRNTFPQAWRKSFIIPIHKSGKPRENVSSYRPIQLTSCLCKTLERMINHRLMWSLERNEQLTPYQSGFRKGRQCLDNIVRLETDIRCGFYLRQYTVAVFLDMHSAYNTVSIAALKQRMWDIGLRGRLPTFVSNFLIERSFQVDCGTLSDEFPQENGLVQGGVLSPTLFLIMINDICQGLPRGVSYSLFADDCAIWAQGSDIVTITNTLQQALNLIETWTNKWGMIFSGRKSTAMIFSRYQPRTTPNRELHIQGSNIPYVDSARFLGVILDSKLNMRLHVEHVKTKIANRMCLLRCISRHVNGADRKTLIRLYKTLIRPVIDYGCQVYDGGAEGYLKQLEPLQNKCLRMATGAFCTSPTLALAVEANLPPLWLRRIELTLRYASRVQSDASHSAYFSLQRMRYLYDHRRVSAPKRSGFPIGARIRKYAIMLDTSIPLNLRPAPNHDPPWLMVKPRTIDLPILSKKDSTHAEIQAAFNETYHDYSDFMFFYTDGSKDDVSTACAFVFGEAYFSDRLPENTSVFNAELFAILRAIQFIRSRRVPKAVICSDSKSALQSLQRNGNFRTIQQLIRQLLHCADVNHQEIRFMWTPSHVGICGNEKADRRAKQALRREEITDFPLDHRDFLPQLHRAVVMFFQRTWYRSRYTFLKHIKPDVGEWSTSHRKSRREEVAMARLRIGHTRLTHSSLLQGDQRLMCPTCNTALTVMHVLIECREYAQERRTLRNHCNTSGIPFDLPHLLGDEPTLTKLLCVYLRETQLIDNI